VEIMNRRLKNFILRRLAILLVSWLPTSSHSFGIEASDATLHHVGQAPLNSLAGRSGPVSPESECCSEVVLHRRYDRVVDRTVDASQIRIVA
jgi:hypothetical protein